MEDLASASLLDHFVGEVDGKRILFWIGGVYHFLTMAVCSDGLANICEIEGRWKIVLVGRELAGLWERRSQLVCALSRQLLVSLDVLKRSAGGAKKEGEVI